MGRKAIFPRPGVGDLLEFVKSKFDIVFWAKGKIEEIVEELGPVFTQYQLAMVRQLFDTSSLQKLGFKKGSDKEILLKDIKFILQSFPQYLPENVVLLDCQPYRCSLNPFYSAIFAESFNGHSKDDFVLGKLLPYLKILHVSKMPLHMTIKSNYPSWGKKKLCLDWKRNDDIWSTIERSGIGNRDHFRKFRQNRDNCKVK